MFLEAESPTLMLPFNSLGGESFTIQTPKNDKKKYQKRYNWLSKNCEFTWEKKENV